MACHHSPNEAGEFASDSGSSDVVGTGEADPLEFAFEPFIGFVCVGNDCRFISLLSGFQRHGFSTDLTSAVTLCAFCEQCSQMRITFLGDSGSADVGATGMLAWNKTQVCSEVVCRGETVEIANFHDGR